MLSVCIIAKNEERVIDKCLSALTIPDIEIIFVDTGSTDGTRETASKYTDKIFDFEWCNDFSAARNFAVSKASYDCILSVDADEVLKASDADAAHLRELADRITRSDDNILGNITCRSFYSNGQDDGGETVNIERIPRMFSKRRFIYSGIVHEQLVPLRNPSDSERTYVETGLTFDHYGYFGDEFFIEQKTARNIELLSRMHEDNPDDPYVLYQLGKSYYMRHDYETARELFDKCLYFDLEPSLEYVSDLVTSYGYTLLNTGRYEAALSLEGIYGDFSHSCEFVFLMGLIYMNNGFIDNAVNEFQKAAKFNACKIEGCNSYKPYYNIGVIYECTGNKKLAREYYKKCGRYSPAKQRLRKL
ncbi:MAG: glycosyltransferase [Lachnospiraceae bacterium]|nr:glycosyltransferase [Lachnospiraceae bacterium]